MRSAKFRQKLAAVEWPEGAWRPAMTKGFFYAVDLFPGAAPRSIKLGFSMDPQDRVFSIRDKHRAPDAVVLGEWPADRAWEHVIMAAAVGADCAQHPGRLEFFTVADVPALIARIDNAVRRLPVKHATKLWPRVKLARLHGLESEYRLLFGRQYHRGAD